MKMTFKRPHGFRFKGKELKRKALQEMADRMKLAVRIATDTIQERTPVYTGRTLVNFQWTIDAPSRSVRKPVASSGLPGRTSTLKLGSEPRRSANAAVVEAEAQALLLQIQKGVYANRLPDLYLVNNSPSYYGVEFGTYSDKARTPPGGITRSLEAKIRVVLR